MLTKEPTLAAIQSERAAEAIIAKANHEREVERARIEKKRRMLAGLAQGLEQLDAEIAASKELRKTLKAGIGKMKDVKAAMVEFETVEDLSFDDIQAHIDLVNKTVRENRGAYPKAGGWILAMAPEFNEFFEKGDIRKAA